MFNGFKDTSYFHIGSARDLKGKDRVLYRTLEIFPGLLTWSTIIGVILFSYKAPLFVAVFIIIFDTYWLLKTAYLSIYLRQSWRRLRYNIGVDWTRRIDLIKYDHIFHLVILPFYDEPEKVAEESIQGILAARWDPKKIIIVLASEEKAGKSAEVTSHNLKTRYGNLFFDFLVTRHPADIPSEIAGKGSNITYAAKAARILLTSHGIRPHDVLVSAFDIDTVPYVHYFLCLTWHFLTHADRFRASYQPVPFYNNNIWQVPAISRVVATSGTFWQMIQQERPDRLATFSSHAISMATLEKINYWQTNIVSEDSRIFWNALMFHAGNYEVVPLSYPVSMDANVGTSFWQTIKNVYKQQRRWSWGVENVPYAMFLFIKSPQIGMLKKIKYMFALVEGFWSLATNSLVIFILGWLPIIIGGGEFHDTVLSFNLPIITRNLMWLSMFGLVLSAIISLSFLPAAPDGYKPRHRFYMIIQWLLVPLTLTLFGAIPAIDAQTRLMFGKYMSFWVTPKHTRF